MSWLKLSLLITLIIKDNKDIYIYIYIYNIIKYP